VRTVAIFTAAVMMVLPVTACSPETSPPAGPSRPATIAEPSTTPVPAPTTAAPTVSATSRPAITTKPTTVPPFPGSLVGKDVERIPTSNPVVALTFDAGANADGLAAILDTLARENIRATFFLTGNFATTYPDQTRRIVNAGHRVGNHSIDHPHFAALSDSQIRAQISSAGTTIRSVSGVSPAPLFRFPYGERDARTIAAVNSAGYIAVRWTVDSLGWQGTMEGTRSASFVSERVLAAAVPGEIVLMHVGAHPTDHSTLDAEALPAIVGGLRARGYSFVTLNALVGG
jgi:peptidoglycan/xylan/chitin deacetylase (PgdA/CDA1 family)